MERSERKQEIKQKATDHFSQQATKYLGEKKLDWIINLSEQLFDDREDAEIEEDEEMGIDSDDYTLWTNEAFEEWRKGHTVEEIKEAEEETVNNDDIAELEEDDTDVTGQKGHDD